MLISKKVIISVILMLFFASSVLGAKMIKNEGQLLANFNDKEFIQDIRVNETKINDAYILQNGVVYVPLKKVVLTLQQQYQYSKKDNWVVVTTPKEKFKLLLNSSQYYIGKEVHNYKTTENLNEIKPIYAKGRIYAPLQFVEEIFSVKQVGKALYIENKIKSIEEKTEIEKETEIQEETISVPDETEQPLENMTNKTKSNKSKSQNTTKRKKKKKKSTSNQSNTALQQQNLTDEDQTDNINQSENNSKNNDENVSRNESETVNETNSGPNESSEGLNEEPTESAPVEQANPTPSEPVSELN